MNARKLLGVIPLQIAQALVGFGAVAAFTRLMSPEQFGVYALALSASMLAHMVVFTWAEAAAYRYFASAKAHGLLKDHFATLAAIAVALSGAAALMTAVALFAFNFEQDMAALCAFAVGAALTRFILRIMRESERAAMQTGRYALSETAYVALGFAGGVAALTWFDLGPAAPFAGALLAGALMLFFDLPRFIALGKGGMVHAPRAQSYAGYGVPVAMALAVSMAVQASMRFILAAQNDLTSTGAFAAAFGLSRPLDIIFLWASAALTPALLSAYETHGPERTRETARHVFTLLAAIAIPAAFGLALLAEPLATLMIGEGLAQEAGRALPWLAFSALIGGFCHHYLAEAFQLTHRTLLHALLMIVPGVGQVALTFVLAPHYGAVGAAAAGLIASLVAAAILIGFGRRLLALPVPIGVLARIGLACAAMTAVVMMPPAPDLVSLAGNVVAGVMTYGATIFLLDLGGIRGRISAISQTLASRLRLRLHSSFTG